MLKTLLIARFQHDRILLGMLVYLRVVKFGESGIREMGVFMRFSFNPAMKRNFSVHALSELSIFKKLILCH